jgi:hypothetical protein
MSGIQPDFLPYRSVTGQHHRLRRPVCSELGRLDEVDEEPAAPVAGMLMIVGVAIKPKLVTKVKKVMYMAAAKISQKSVAVTLMAVGVIGNSSPA